MGRKPKDPDEKLGKEVTLRFLGPEGRALLARLDEDVEREGKERSETIRTAIKLYLDTKYDSKKIDHFWKANPDIFEDLELAETQVSLPEYIRITLKKEDQYYCSKEIYEHWIDFQLNLIEIFFAPGEHPSYARFLQDSGKMEDPLFSELKVALQDSPQNQDDINYDFFRKRMKAEIYFYLKREDALTPMNQIPLDKFIDIIPGIARLVTKEENNPFLRIIQPGNPQSNILSPLLHWDFFFSLIGDIKKSGKIKKQQQEMKRFYDSFIIRIISIKDFNEPILLKMIPGFQQIIDFEGFFNYLWDQDAIIPFLEKACISNISQYFRQFVSGMKNLLVQNHENYAHFNQELEAFYEFVSHLSQIPLSPFFQQQLNQLEKHKIEFHKVLKYWMEAFDITTDSAKMDPKLEFLKKPNPLIETWKKFAQDEKIDQFMKEFRS